MQPPAVIFFFAPAHCRHFMFLSLDGIDGVGKSTQLKLLVEELEKRGQEVITCREPGSTQLGESIRKILLNDWETPIDGVSEMLLYMASRAQLVEEVIRPALQSGKTVVADRKALRKGFLAEAARQPERIQLVAASGTVEEVAERIWLVVDQRLGSDSK
jgi:thymidylate kinase